MSDKPLTRCATQLGRAHLEIDRLARENHQLRDTYSNLEPSQREDQLWLALSHWSCTCREEADRQIEALPLPTDHAEGCEYITVHREITEAVKNA